MAIGLVWLRIETPNHALSQNQGLDMARKSGFIKTAKFTVTEKIDFTMTKNQEL